VAEHQPESIDCDMGPEIAAVRRGPRNDVFVFVDHGNIDGVRRLDGQ
jgi:hypothetical protein